MCGDAKRQRNARKAGEKDEKMDSEYLGLISTTVDFLTGRIARLNRIRHAGSGFWVGKQKFDRLLYELSGPGQFLGRLFWLGKSLPSTYEFEISHFSIRHLSNRRFPRSTFQILQLEHHRLNFSVRTFRVWCPRPKNPLKSNLPNASFPPSILATRSSSSSLPLFATCGVCNIGSFNFFQLTILSPQLSISLSHTWRPRLDNPSKSPFLVATFPPASHWCRSSSLSLAEPSTSGVGNINLSAWDFDDRD